MDNLVKRAQIENILTTKTHSCYYYYTKSIDYCSNSNSDEFYLFFSPCKNWNDKIDEKQTKKKEINNTMYNYFYRCLSYFKSESIAMWKIYAEEGACLRLSQSIVENFINNIKRVVLCFENSEIEIDKNDVIPYRTQDVVYYNELADGDIFIMRSNHKTHITKREFERYESSHFFKHIGWNYECESRLSIAIPNIHFKKMKKILGVKVYLRPDKRYKIKRIISPCKIMKNKRIDGDFSKSEFADKITL